MSAWTWMCTSWNAASLQNGFTVSENRVGRGSRVFHMSRAFDCETRAPLVFVNLPKLELLASVENPKAPSRQPDRVMAARLCTIRIRYRILASEGEGFPGRLRLVPSSNSERIRRGSEWVGALDRVTTGRRAPAS